MYLSWNLKLRNGGGPGEKTFSVLEINTFNFFFKIYKWLQKFSDNQMVVIYFK